jgi:hypothetical protein
MTVTRFDAGGFYRALAIALTARLDSHLCLLIEEFELEEDFDLGRFGRGGV